MCLCECECIEVGDHNHNQHLSLKLDEEELKEEVGEVSRIQSVPESQEGKSGNLREILVAEELEPLEDIP